MQEERVNFKIVFKVLVSLLPILFGMPTLAMVICAYTIAMTFLCIGPITTLVASLSGVCLSMLFCGTFGEGAKLQGLFLGAEAIICGFACVYAVIKQKGFYTGVWLSSLAFLTVSFAELFNAAAAVGMSVAEYLTSAPMELARAQFAAISETGVNLPSDVVEKLLEVLHRATVMMVPSILVISSLAIGYATMWLVTSQMRKLPVGLTHSFGGIKVPRTTVVIMAISLLLFVLSPEGNMAYISLNVLIILVAVCFFAGMSFVDFYLRRPVKSTFFRVIIHLFVFMCATVFSGISPYVNVFTVYVLIAAVDSFANFRKLCRSSDEGGTADEAEEREV